MPIFNQLIILCWLIFVVYWLVSAIGVKKNIKSHSLWKSISLRLGVVIILLILARTTPLFGHNFRYFFQSIEVSKAEPHNFILSSIGVVLAVLGIAFSIWARGHLGRNWGMPMSVKEKPDLITTGPYAYIRHPIYTGMLTAMLGSVCVGGVFWLVPFVMVSVCGENPLLVRVMVAAGLGVCCCCS
jgi:protein-S-isoprenylcysteine O-methyltransferase Ste14